MKRWQHRNWHEAPPNWKPHRRWLLRRFVFGLVSFALMMAGLMWLISSLLAPLFGGDPKFAGAVWLLACGTALALPMVAMGVSMTLFRRYGTPLAQVIAVTEAVAGGDLSARVESVPNGRVGQLASSVNHMVEEIEQNETQRRQLTADIAHELRTPLHIIQGNLEGVLDGVYEPTTEHIENTLEETRLLARLVNDLRTLSLAEAGQLPLRIEPVDVLELLTDVQTSFSGSAESNQIDLRIEAPNDNLTFEGDIDRLNQVLGNLVSNAIRHTVGGEIVLGAKRKDDVVVLTVADTGEGIAEEELGLIFGRFWRGDRARTHAEGVGGGLGLAIARQLVHAHNGTISVASRVGVGTTFTIEIPSTFAKTGKPIQLPA